MAAKSYEIDMCHGPLAGKILMFSLPLMLSGMLQLLFNAADIVVVGRFAGDEALAAVGSTGSLVNLLINLFVGLSTGANVVVSRALGARDAKYANDAVHTAITLSLIGGVMVAFIGIALVKPILHLMSFPDSVLNLAALYLRIYFAGMPAVLLYNYGSAILRAMGDTKRPLYILVLSGIVNVVLNLVFVIVFNMSVAGVAIATIISQLLSGLLVLRCLANNMGLIKFEPKKLKIHKKKLVQILRVGIPSGIQGMVFSLANITLQSAINTFGAEKIAGNAAAANLEGFVYIAMNSFYQSAITFTGQNMGAGEYKRIRKILLYCYTFAAVCGLILGNLMAYFSEPLLKIYTSGEVAIQTGTLRLAYVCGLYFLCGLMEVSSGVLRGMGLSVIPMIVSLVGACGLRLVWVWFVFPIFGTMPSLLIIFPISWFVTFSAHLLFIIINYKKLIKRKVKA